MKGLLARDNHLDDFDNLSRDVEHASLIALPNGEWHVPQTSVSYPTKTRRRERPTSDEPSSDIESKRRLVELPCGCRMLCSTGSTGFTFGHSCSVS